MRAYFLFQVIQEGRPAVRATCGDKLPGIRLPAGGAGQILIAFTDFLEDLEDVLAFYTFIVINRHIQLQKNAGEAKLPGPVSQGLIASLSDIIFVSFSNDSVKKLRYGSRQGKPPIISGEEFFPFSPNKKPRGLPPGVLRFKTWCCKLPRS
jgi:hypothetical protein